MAEQYISKYIKVNFTIIPAVPFEDLLCAELGTLGFESFELENGKVVAYIPQPEFNPESLHHLETSLLDGVSMSHSVEVIDNQNWNELWEKNFDPIEVNDQCRIRAPFHEAKPGVKYEIIIHPQMSFGTGHHPTTFLMIQEIMKAEIAGKDVLDMGSGTGILAVLCEKMDAALVDAVDVDEWSFKNMPENFELNNCSKIRVFHGGVDQVEDNMYDVILANINRNVLLADVTIYNHSLKRGGYLLLSGFISEDAKMMKKHVGKHAMDCVTEVVKNDWVLQTFRKRHDAPV